MSRFGASEDVACRWLLQYDLVTMWQERPRPQDRSFTRWRVTGLSLRLIAGCAFGLLSLQGIGPSVGRSGTPAPPTLVVPVNSLREIAADFEAGRNVLYCYYGRVREDRPQVYVDSLRAVTTAADCGGVGVALISRIGDNLTMMAMLRGLIDAHPEFQVVSAFYKTEMLEVDGEEVRVAHALSILRGQSITRPVSRS